MFGGGGERWGKGEWEARVSDFFFTKNPHLKYFFPFFFGGGGGGGRRRVGRGRGGGARVSDFFTKDPNLIFFFWGGGGGGREVAWEGARISEFLRLRIQIN